MAMHFEYTNGDEQLKNDSEMAQIDEQWEKWYREHVVHILGGLNLTEGSTTILPIKYRPLLGLEDVFGFPDDVFVRGEIAPGVGYSEQEPNTVVRAKEHVSYEIYLRKSDTTLPNGYIPLKIFVMYSKTQKQAFRYIFENMLNSSRPIEMIIRGYGISEEYQLGELCLVSPPPDILPNAKRRKILFIKNCTSLIIDCHGSMGYDVSALARYVDKKYADLTAELNNPPAFRQWTLEDAEDKIEAKYQSSMDAEVTLENTDGELIKIEMSRLSKPDQLYVQRRMEIARYEAEQKASEPPGTLTDSNGVPENADMSPNTSVPPTAKRGSVLVSVVVTLIILGLLAYGAFYFIRHYWH
jgi:hypothetical protein